MAFRKGLFLLPWRFMDVPEAASFLADHGINHISLSARDSQGLAFYGSNVIPRPFESQEDILTQCADLFHARGMTLHASLAAFADMYGADQHPEWLTVRHDGVRAGPGSTWDHWADAWYYPLCPLNPEVQNRLLDVCREVAAYPVDGLDLDFIRFPYQPAGDEYQEGWFCYCDCCRSQYRAAMGAELPLPGVAAPEDWDRWITWRADGLASFVGRVREVVRAAGDKRLHAFIAVYGAPSTGRDQVALTRARYGQDLDKLRSVLDAIQPMIYHRFVQEPLYYTRHVLFWLKTMTYWARQTGNEVWPVVQGCDPIDPQEVQGALENAINGGADSILLYPGREWHLTPERWDAIGKVLSRVQ